jgi:signal transduction histidine kinase
MSRIDYRRLFEATPTPYLILTPEFRIVEVNQAYLDATMRSRDSLVGEGIFDAFPDNPDDPEATGVRNLRASLERAVASSAPDVMAVQKYDITTGDGSFEERYWSPINTPVLAADGTVILIIHRVQDVTDFVRARSGDPGEDLGARRLERGIEMMETDLFLRSEQLGEANRSKDRFLAMLAHELRNPLAVLKGAIEVLETVPDDPAVDQDMRHLIGLQVQALARLTEDLLDASRAVAGKLQLERARLDLGEVADGAVEAARTGPRGAERTISLDLPDDPVMVSGDAVRLSQVFGNLIGNALKFTEPGGTVEVAVAAGEQVTIEVTDNGDGFAPERAPELFEVFSQADEEVALRSGGLGLGLPIVRSIVELHGGEIECSSDGPGTGASFTVTLPAINPSKGAGTRFRATAPRPSRFLPGNRRAARPRRGGTTEPGAPGPGGAP